MIWKGRTYASVLRGEELAAELELLFQGGGELRLAVAFWGKGAANYLGLVKGNKGRIICNLGMGGTNPDEIRVLMDHDFTVRQCDKLHSKVYIGDGGVIIGSSNASANGLSFDGTEECEGWTETNVLLKSPCAHSKLTAWFDEFWNSEHVYKIDGDCLEKARKYWELRQSTNNQLKDARVESERTYFTLSLPKEPDVKARAWLQGSRFIVEEGSTARKKYVGSNVESTYGRLFYELVKQEVMILRENNMVFSRSYAFTSTSAAASVVAGRSMPGPSKWLVEGTVKTYGEFERENLAAPNGDSEMADGDM